MQDVHQCRWKPLLSILFCLKCTWVFTVGYEAASEEAEAEALATLEAKAKAAASRKLNGSQSQAPESQFCEAKVNFGSIPVSSRDHTMKWALNLRGAGLYVPTI